MNICIGKSLACATWLCLVLNVPVGLAEQDDRPPTRLHKGTEVDRDGNVVELLAEIDFPSYAFSPTVRVGFAVRIARQGQSAADYSAIGTPLCPFEGIPDDGSLGTFGSVEELPMHVDIYPSEDSEFGPFASLLADSTNDEIDAHTGYFRASDGQLILSPSFGGPEWGFAQGGPLPGSALRFVRLAFFHANGVLDPRWQLWGERGETPSTAPICPDITCDGVVGFDDITAVLASWGSAGPLGDADRNDSVDFADITAILSRWGETCK